MNLSEERAKRERNALRVSLLEALGVAVILALMAALLSGCVTVFQGVCAVQPIGVTDGGLQAIAVQCEAVE